MDDYERLRRSSYQADANHKAMEQEAEELGRSGFRPDGAAKAAQQEAYERQQEGRVRASRSRAAAGRATSASDDAPMHDMADRTVVRRTTSNTQVASGGAVISKRSGIGAAVRRKIHEEGSPSRVNERAAKRERRRLERQQRRMARGGRGHHFGLLVLVAAIVALYLAILGPIDRAISFTAQEREGLGSELKWHVPGMPYYVLALGSDARDGETSSRTDTMILIRVDTLGGKLTMLSIPRDTMVEIDGYGTQKINAAYTFGGVAGAVKEVHELTGVPISQAAMIRFDGLESLVDYLGGVTVNVPVEVYDPDYTGLVLPAGEQEMDGHTALLYSRVRHGFDMGDYQRQADQRILIEAIMNKALGLSPTRLPGLMQHMGGMLGTSMRMYSILPLMLRLKVGGATIYQATVPSTTAMVDGVSYVVADEQALSQMMEVIENGGDPASVA